MTDQPTARAGMVELISQALQVLAYLYAHNRVTITNLWSDSGSGAGITARDRMIVRADVTGLPAERGALLAGLAPITEPTEWSGTYTTHREWAGNLLTMRVVVSYRLDVPPESAADSVVEPPKCVGAPTGFEAACGAAGPHGEHPMTSPAVPDEPLPEIGGAEPGPGKSPAHLAAHAVRWHRGASAGHAAAADAAPAEAFEPAGNVSTVPEPPVDHRPLLGLVVDERFGDLKQHIIEVHGELGQTTEDLKAKYAGIPGVVVVPGNDKARDPKVIEAFRQYAIARALHDLAPHADRFWPSLAEALTAVNAWPGRDMLEDDWALDAARQLVDPSAAEADRDPATARAAARGRLRRLVPPALRGRGGEVVVR